MNSRDSAQLQWLKNTENIGGILRYIDEVKHKFMTSSWISSGNSGIKASILMGWLPKFHSFLWVIQNSLWASMFSFPLVTKLMYIKKTKRFNVLKNYLKEQIQMYRYKWVSNYQIKFSKLFVNGACYSLEN